MTDDMARGAWRFYLGALLYAVSLFVLGLSFSPILWIAVLVPGMGALLAYAVTAHRAAFVTMIVLMFGLFGSAALTAIVLGHYLLIPVSVAQIAAISLLDGRRVPDWAGRGLLRRRFSI
ncbi:MAG: hypothetical protein V4472_04345 [Pseudomonadota bacterium]